MRKEVTIEIESEIGPGMSVITETTATIDQSKYHLDIPVPPLDQGDTIRVLPHDLGLVRGRTYTVRFAIGDVYSED